MFIKDIAKGKAATALMLVFILLCLASIMLVRGQPESVEKDIEINCKWKGVPVSANLKWTETKGDPVTTPIKDADNMSKSGTTSSQVNSTINTQQALMLTGASAGAALAGGGLLIKKKLEGSGPSEQESKQTTSTGTINKELLMQKQMDSQSPSQQSQPPTQTQQSSIQNPPKDNGLTPTASTLTASGATITKDLLMQKQIDSLTNQSQAPKQSQPDVQKLETDVATATLTSSTATITRELLMQKQVDSQTKPPKQETASPTSQNLGLLASSSSSAAQIAAEMWPQRQKELERLAKQRADLEAKFSVPSYSTDLGLASSFTSATGNAWAKLQGFGSTISNGLSNAWTAIKPYAPAILLTVIIVTAVYGGLVFGLFGAGMTGVGMASTGVAAGGISLGGGAGWVGAGIAVGLGTYTAYNLGIMNHPQQPSFEVEHTQIIEKPTSEIKDEKGSGTYGVDPAQEQLEQAEIGKNSIIERHTGGPDHQKSEEQTEEWLQDEGQVIERDHCCERNPSTGKNYPVRLYGEPDYITKDYIVECKIGTDKEYDYTVSPVGQVRRYLNLIKQLKEDGVIKTLVYWFLEEPGPGSKWAPIIDMLKANGAIIRSGNKP